VAGGVADLDLHIRVGVPQVEVMDREGVAADVARLGILPLAVTGTPLNDVIGGDGAADLERDVGEVALRAARPSECVLSVLWDDVYCSRTINITAAIKVA